MCVCVGVSRSLERDLNRGPRLVAPGLNSKMSKLGGEDSRGRGVGARSGGAGGVGAIRGDDLFTRVGRVMN